MLAPHQSSPLAAILRPTAEFQRDARDLKSTMSFLARLSIASQY